MQRNLLFILSIVTVNLFFSSCNRQDENRIDEPARSTNDSAFTQVMQKHLNAVTNRDIETLKSTMSPTGEMQLILPGSEIITSVDGFMNYHRDWFKDSTWTFETKILNTKMGNNMGMAVVEVVYREPDREGKPYFNRMIVSYDLEKIDGKWYIIKDHVSSVEKSTDPQ